MSKTEKGMTLKEASEYLGVSYWTLRRYLKKGAIAFSRVENKWKREEYRFHTRDLDDFMTQKEPARPRRRSVRRKPGHKTAPGPSKQPQEPAAMSENDYLSRYIKQLESENQFLRQEMIKKDRQIDSNVQVINRLTHQTEVLLALTQGVDIQMLIKGEYEAGERAPQPVTRPSPEPRGDEDFQSAQAGTHAPESEREARQHEPEPEAVPKDQAVHDAPQQEAPASGHLDKLSRLVAQLSNKGMATGQIAIYFNKQKLPRPDSAQPWDIPSVQALMS